MRSSALHVLLPACLSPAHCRATTSLWKTWPTTTPPSTPSKQQGHLALETPTESPSRPPGDSCFPFLPCPSNTLQSLSHVLLRVAEATPLEPPLLMLPIPGYSPLASPPLTPLLSPTNTMSLPSPKHSQLPHPHFLPPPTSSLPPACWWAMCTQHTVLIRSVSQSAATCLPCPCPSATLLRFAPAPALPLLHTQPLTLLS